MGPVIECTTGDDGQIGLYHQRTMTPVIRGSMPGAGGARPVTLGLAGGLISEVDESDPDDSGPSPILTPGFVDLQVNGGWGHDITSSPSAIWPVGERLVEHGVTSFLPTIVSAPESQVDAAIEVLRAGPPEGYSGARALGLHLEGPWISPEWCGAHDSRHLTLPDAEVAARWAESGVVAMVTMAPELPGANRVAQLLSGAGVTVSVGHTGSTYSQAMDAFAGGWAAATHLYNQMTPFHHRAPGVVGAILEARPFTGVIADGLHCHRAAVRLAWDRLGPDRMFLVSDAIAPVGLGEGAYRLGGVEVDMAETGPRMADGRLAGSISTLDEGLRNLLGWVEAGLNDVIRSVTSTPARVVGKSEIGGLAEGQWADLVLLSPDLEVLSTYVAGEPVF